VDGDAVPVVRGAIVGHKLFRQLAAGLVTEVSALAGQREDDAGGSSR